MISNNILYFVLNYIGGTIRFIFGKGIRIFFKNKPKFEFGEYISGPKEGDFTFDKIGHRFINRIIAICFLLILFVTLSQL